MNILRITAQWSGFPGAPGYSNFFFAADPGFFDGGILTPDAEVAATNARDRVGDAFDAISALIPQGVTVETQGEAVILDSDTGESLNSIDIPSLTVDAAINSGATFAGPVGGVVNWRTNDYRFGRRIRGRTFLVPLTTLAFEDDGTLLDSSRTRLRAFGTAMIGDGGPAFGVWSRPRAGAGGVFATVTSASVPDLAAVLRSRRD